MFNYINYILNLIVNLAIMYTYLFEYKPALISTTMDSDDNTFKGKLISEAERR